ncbi:MAG TPA: GNAT family protein [Oscillospiraceae bacterium]|nr:GNAT family protein [Oscillospiraceae bacterium]HPF57030.1 GNAT family protein [Clostridiales bacterium]HPK35952.1 GNAT family protein [Oscillospiraceae bacterium]HPR75645.1 GNAT family protein [Oscillospiraceae bacterium]
MEYYKKIIGERLYLSPVNPDEVDAYLKWMNEDYKLAINFGQYPLTVSSKNDLNWLYEPPKNMHRYAIVLLENDALIGSISLHNIDHLNRNAYIGIFIGGEENRGKGYGAEAIRLILNYGFKTMNLHSINLTVHADNHAGIKCYKKVGFKEVGRLPEVFFINGKYVDKIYMSILESEFKG